MSILFFVHFFSVECVRNRCKQQQKLLICAIKCDTQKKIDSNGHLMRMMGALASSFQSFQSCCCLCLLPISLVGRLPLSPSLPSQLVSSTAAASVCTANPFGFIVYYLCAGWPDTAKTTAGAPRWVSHLVSEWVCVHYTCWCFIFFFFLSFSFFCTQVGNLCCDKVGVFYCTLHTFLLQVWK